MKSEASAVCRWHVLRDEYHAIAGRLDQALQRAHLLSMTEFETLDHIVGGTHQRMCDVASAMYLSQSAFSRTVARLEKDGLVIRSHCDNDRRVVMVDPTEAGIRHHARAQETYLAVIEGYLGAAEVLSPPITGPSGHNEARSVGVSGSR
jgi:DNA-binding MarR family transcriptional regulator